MMPQDRVTFFFFFCHYIKTKEEPIKSGKSDIILKSSEESTSDIAGIE